MVKETQYKKIKRLDKEYFGVVIENKDPKKLKRVKIFIPNFLEGSVDVLPWCYPITLLGGNKQLSTCFVPKIGTKVRVNFLFDTIYLPIYSGSIDTEETMNETFKVNYPLRSGYVNEYMGLSIIADEYEQSLEIQHGSGARITIKKMGEISITSPNGIDITSSGPISMISEQDILIMSKEKVKITSGDDVEIGALGKIRNLCRKGITLDGKGEGKLRGVVTEGNVCSFHGSNHEDGSFSVRSS